MKTVDQAQKNHYSSSFIGASPSQSQFDKFNVNLSTSAKALNRFTTNQPKGMVNNYQSMADSQLKSLEASKTLASTGKMNMSERQSEWYLTDKRLIFSCSSMSDFQTWVTKIEELISHNANQMTPNSNNLFNMNSNGALLMHNHSQSPTYYEGGNNLNTNLGGVQSTIGSRLNSIESPIKNN